VFEDVSDGTAVERVVDEPDERIDGDARGYNRV
jgi:hypothetical protein